MLVRVHVKHSGLTSTAAAATLLTQQPAGLHFIPPFSSELVPGLIAMLLMTAPALSHARLMNMPLFSVLLLAMGRIQLFLCFTCFFPLLVRA